MKMQIEYRQEMNRQYMVFHLKKDPSESSYVQRMILENKVRGLAVCTPATVDGDSMLYYEVSGWITLKDYIHNNPVSCTFLYGLIRNLANIFDELQRYLIPSACVAIGTGEIFTDTAGRKFLFAAVPEKDPMLEATLQRLSEVLISKIPHNDHKAIAAGYDLYQMSINGSITSEKLRSICSDQEVSEEEAVLSAQSSWIDEKPLFPGKEKEIEETSGKNNTGFRFLVSAFLNKLKAKTADKKQKIYPAKDDSEDLDFFSEYMAPESRPSAFPVSPGTVFVRSDHFSSTGSECTLVPLHQTDGVPLIAGKSFCRIGRSPADADLVIQNETVSRIHAHLLCQNGTYTISDCHSTNGTKVNGRAVSPEKDVFLSNGDRICFGTAEYRVQINETSL